ncbi:MAG: hypothetical protein HY918_04980 [Candidatus Doudnabacteria bacterium]|nr:hypothetical protein [Candidatus Doudnabacteria bacterium]
MFVNLTIVAAMIAAAFTGLAGGLIVGAGAIIGGIWNLANAYRQQTKAWITYAFFWAVLYVGGHIAIAAVFPGYFSTPTALWTLCFLGTTAVATWTLGGIPLDMAIAFSSLPDEDFEKLMKLLAAYSNGGDNANLPAVRGITHPVATLTYYFAKVMGYPIEILLFVLPLYRRMGQGFFRFLKFAFMLGSLT